MRNLSVLLLTTVFSWLFPVINSVEIKGGGNNILQQLSKQSGSLKKKQSILFKKIVDNRKLDESSTSILCCVLCFFGSSSGAGSGSSSLGPSTSPTTSHPTTSHPTTKPSISPVPTAVASSTPSLMPSEVPSDPPSLKHSSAPSVPPTVVTSDYPTGSPSSRPSNWNFPVHLICNSGLCLAQGDWGVIQTELENSDMKDQQWNYKTDRTLKQLNSGRYLSVPDMGVESTSVCFSDDDDDGYSLKYLTPCFIYFTPVGSEYEIHDEGKNNCIRHVTPPGPGEVEWGACDSNQILWTLVDV